MSVIKLVRCRRQHKVLDKSTKELNRANKIISRDINCLNEIRYIN